MFETQLGKNIEVYIDDMVVKNKVESKNINISEIFSRYRGDINCTSTPLNVLLG